MKNLILVLGLLCTVTVVQAQTTALDWTKEDCDGNMHSLSEDLHNGKIVIMEIVMMNCTPCVIAGNALSGLMAEYETAYPGKVKMYSISYNNSTTCAALKQWKSMNDFSWPVIANGAEQTTYYGGMGMPTIVIAGGSAGDVLYKKLGYETKDLSIMRNAIDAAIASSDVKMPQSASLLRIYPNPASTLLHIESAQNAEIRSYSLFDQLGKTILASEYSTPDISVAGIANGSYYLRAVLGDGSIMTIPVQISR